MNPAPIIPAAECCAPLPRREGVLRINYGINRRRPGSPRKTDIEHKNGKMTITGRWDSDETHRQIRSMICENNPGWLITGYCLSDPQNASSEAAKGSLP